jgi:signal transduction histidine kinase
MRVPRPAGYPANRTAASWVFDVFVTVVAHASTAPELVHDGTRPHGAELAVLALTVTPLLARRIWPVPVFGLVVAAAVAAGLWDRHLADGLALLIALYTVASLRPRRDALACTAVLELVAVAALFWYAGSTWWFDGIFVSGMIAAALGLGLYSAARRAYLAELHDRAERLERERDQQVALAAAAERARIAREMHDIVAHHLTVMTTLAEGAAAASAGSPEHAAAAMRAVAVTGRRALADTRRLLGVLRENPGEGAGTDNGTGAGETLEPVPGLAQLDALFGQVRSAGLDTRVEISGQAPDISEGVQLAVYRLVQEALTNTLKHGGPAARARVRLRFLPGELRVDVDDNGAGTTAPPSVSPGGGLPGMKERIRAYGGEVAAGPRQPAGWAVSARLPLDEGEIR